MNCRKPFSPAGLLEFLLKCYKFTNNWNKKKKEKKKEKKETQLLRIAT